MSSFWLLKLLIIPPLAVNWKKAPPADLPIKIGLIFLQNSYTLPSMQLYDFGLKKMLTIITAKW